MPEQLQDDDPTIGRLVHDASRDISTLVTKEIQLAKSELKVSVKAGGIGHRPVRRRGVHRWCSRSIMLSFAIAYFIHWNGDGLDLQWAFLIVFGFYVLVAALLGFIGVRKVKQVRAPEKAIEQGREIPKALRGQTQPRLAQAAQSPVSTCVGVAERRRSRPPRATWSAVSA